MMTIYNLCITDPCIGSYYQHGGALSRVKISSFCCCASLSLSLQLVSAYPSIWVTLHLSPQGNGETNPPGLTCIDHPAASYGGHGAPTGLTSSIVFTLKDSTGAAETKICPGQPYSLQVRAQQQHMQHMQL